ncbi:MAG: putative sulfate exporter family transporter [Caulobacteraceae bacterium]|nr:putative sulfate exporter family transporter [Caulobacteraceae bacterium]
MTGAASVFPRSGSGLPRRWLDAAWAVTPGLALSLGVVAVAQVGAGLERAWFGGAWMENVVLAILMGVAVRAFWTPGARLARGVAFSAKLPLEIAIVLLGASVGAGSIAKAGPLLLLGIVGVVIVALAASYALSRALGLSHRVATLIACGNAICGNSAIAAIAPVVGADRHEACAAIGFTAVLGVVVVLALPALGHALGLSGLAYGAVAGLTVYAVPQVLAATAPAGALATQVGAMVKLTRVMMLGPVIAVIGLSNPAVARPPLTRLVPWFVVGFAAVALLRAAGGVPNLALMPIAALGNALMLIAMAALGLSTDVRAAIRAGGKLALAAILSIVLLGLLAVGLVFLLGLR